MDITARFHGNCAILDLSGKFLTREDTMALRNAVGEALTTRCNHIVLDLGKVSYIDSCGIGELIKSFSLVRSQGGRLVLMDLPARVRHLLAISRLDRVFEIIENEELAIADLPENPLQRRLCG